MTDTDRVGGPGSGGRMQAAMGAAAKLFGMSTQDLASAIAGGQSMSDIAKAKGVSADDLHSAIKSAVQQAGAQGVSGTSDDRADRIADRIASHKGGHGHRHHHGTQGVGDPGAVAAPASTDAPGTNPRLDTVI